MGMALSSKAWLTGGQEMTALLAPILAFTSITEWRGHELTDAEAEVIKQAIAPNIRAIHAYWLARRDEFSPATTTLTRDTPKVGRDEPCPFGSGKKYKKRCLH
jgi:uncharacterized protein